MGLLREKKQPVFDVVIAIKKKAEKRIL